MFWSYGRWISLHANYLPTRFGIICLTYAYRWHILQLLRQIWCERSLSKISSMIFECMSAILLYLWVELILYTVHLQNTSKNCQTANWDPNTKLKSYSATNRHTKYWYMYWLAFIIDFQKRKRIHLRLAKTRVWFACHTFCFKQIVYTCLHTWPKWSLITDL